MPIMSLEDMLEFIAKKNNIRSYNLFEYEFLYHYDDVESFQLHEEIKPHVVYPIKVRDYLKNVVPNLEVEHFIGIKSKVNLKDNLGYWNSKMVGSAYLHFLDFKCPVSKENFEKVRQHLKDKNLFGFVCDSGNSYHFYSDTTHLDYSLDSYAFSSFIKNAKQSELVDKNWCNFQLKRGFSVLRLSEDENKPKPKVIAYLGGTDLIKL